MTYKSVCDDCFFYEFTDKSCAKEMAMPEKEEECHSFTPRITVTLFDEMSDGEGEEVSSYKKI